jgi:hypothetical protein
MAGPNDRLLPGVIRRIRLLPDVQNAEFSRVERSQSDHDVDDSGCLFSGGIRIPSASDNIRLPGTLALKRSLSEEGLKKPLNHVPDVCPEELIDRFSLYPW